MTTDTLIMLSGFFVAVVPFLGFPNTYDAVFLFCAGGFIIGLGILVRRRILRLWDTPPSHERQMFTEHVPHDSR